ncbi:MAG: helicase RepA family protein [Pseudomonadota bacterium]
MDGRPVFNDGPLSQNELAEIMARTAPHEAHEAAYREHAPTPQPITLESFTQASEPFLDDAWLVEDVLPLRGLGCVFGAPGTAKTFSALDMALHVAAGLDWRRKHVERRAVLYASLEGGNTFRNRVAAWKLHHGVRHADFYRCPVALNLRSTERDTERLITAAKAFTEPVGLVVIDTLNRALAGGNENASEDMGAFVAHRDAIAAALDCLVLVVHHSGKDAARGARGHSLLLGALDLEISVEDDVLTVTKQRDGEDGISFAFEREVVEVGSTPRGKRVTSLVVVEGEARERGPKLTTGQRHTLEAVRQYIDDHGEPNPGGTGFPVPGRVRLTGRDGLVEHLAGKQQSSAHSERCKQASRKLDRLMEVGVVQQNQSLVWIVSDGSSGSSRVVTHSDPRSPDGSGRVTTL